MARLPGVVVWVPDGSDRSQRFVAACLESGGALELLARIGRSIADPSVKQWPRFCVVAARDEELVVLVHGPLDVTVDSDAGSTVLRGGDDTGAWVSRSLGAPRSVSAGVVPGDGHSADGHSAEGHNADGHSAEGHGAEGHSAEGDAVGGALVNLALGVLRADGFTLVLGPAQSAGQGPMAQGTVPKDTGGEGTGQQDDGPQGDDGHQGDDGPNAGGRRGAEEAPQGTMGDRGAGGAPPVRLREPAPVGEPVPVGEDATCFDYQGAPTQAPAMDVDAGAQGSGDGLAAASVAPRGGVRARLGWARGAVAARSGAEDATLVEGPELGAVTIIDAPGPASSGRRDEVHASGPGAGMAATVRGVYCPRGHFNDPRAQGCRRCGARIAHDAPQVDGPRPPLGSLNWDDGEVSSLGQGALVGRDVAGDEAVSAGNLVAVVPRGVNDSMSRVHAEVRAAGWDVTVLDRGSTNGTFIWDEAARAWQRLVPGEEELVGPGTVLAFGERTATFEL